MKNSVLLIQPFRKPSLREVLVKNYPCIEIINSDALILGAVIEQAGYQVDFLSLQNIFKSFDNEQYEQLEELLNEYHPDYVIFHTDYYIAFTSTAIFYSVKKITEHYKKKSPHIKFILVGRNGLAMGEKVFDLDENIDIVMKGECETAIVSVLKAFDSANMEGIPGIIYKSHGKYRETAGEGNIGQIDRLPVPAFHLLNHTRKIIEKYARVKVSSLPVSIRTSYGCPMHCRYCGGIRTWNNYHCKSKEYLDREIAYFQQVMGTEGQILFIADELFTYKKEHIQDVVEVLTKYKIRLGGLFAHSAFFTDEIAEMLSDITDMVFFGGENCCDEVLVIANKQQTFDSLMRAVEIAKRHGLGVTLEWIVGMPGENIRTAAQNINNIYNLLVTRKVDMINTYVLCPYPNTEFADNMEMYGLKVFDSIDEMLEEGYPTYSTKQLSSNQIYVYYLLSQLVVRMALIDKESFKGKYPPMQCNIDRFEEIMKKVEGNRS